MESGARKRVEQEYFDASVRGEYARGVNVYDQEFLDHLTTQTFDWVGPLKDRRVLFYGCGVNWDTADRFRSLGAQTIMIDLSFESMRQLTKKVVQEQATKELMAVQMDCESLGFTDQAFDIVYGRAILHHLSIEQAAKEIARVLKPGARAVFQEPLNMNPIINLFRWLTPRWRTPTEHPLSFRDIETIGRYFGRMKHVEFGLTATFGIMINALLVKLGGAPRQIRRLLQLDAFLTRRVPWLRRFCWGTIIVLER